MRKNIRCRLLISTALLSLPAIAAATETVVYTYDALGRLTGSATTGTVNGGVQTSTSFDPAGNRAGYSVSGVGGVGTPPPPPPPTPPPPPPPPAPNQPPVFVSDPVLSAPCNDSNDQNVLGNDTDPEGNLPLSLTLTGGTGINYVSPSGTQSITFFAPAKRGAYSVTYTIRDSRGATATGTLNLQVTGSVAQCTGGGVQPIQTTGTGG